MDPAYFPTIAPHLRPGAVVVVNSSLFDVPVDVEGAQVFEVPASSLADEVGNPMTAGFVLLGAFAALTGLVSVDGLVAAMRQLVPPYRTQHLAANEQAIGAGAGAVTPLAAPAWPLQSATPAGTP
jgi:2-oxoglutarate ferredoxin oxidoreductase subunit gamma